MSSEPSRPGSEPHSVQVTLDARIPTGDPDVTLSADLYLPETPEPVPALVSAYPYRKDLPTGSSSMAAVYEEFAASGYACVLVDLRGTGGSDGIQRPVCDAGEGDDLVDAITWSSSQEWCTGLVGMWGLSYGGVTTLRAATRKPEALRAIMPMVCPADPEREGMFPNGSRIDMLQRVWWAGGLLANQIMPPMLGHTEPEAYTRWQQRLHTSEPYLIDLAEHVAGDPSWRDRAIDPATITIPTFCVGGWRDLYSAAVVRTFLELGGPKKLLMGPWGHTLPQHSPDEPIDFLPIALRWWDHWLKGIDTGVMDEPPVTLHVGGDAGTWHALPSMPTTPTWSAAVPGDLRLRDAVSEQQSGHDAVAVYEPDSTLGMLGGPLGLAGHPVGQPLDVRDESGCVVVDTARTHGGAVICGSGAVVVEVRPQRRSFPERLVARLAEVSDAHGTRFLAAGVLVPTGPLATYRIELDPVAWKLAPGSRLRVLLSDGDFPRLTPLARPDVLHFSSVRLELPVLDAAEAKSNLVRSFPSVSSRDRLAPGATGMTGKFTITRDLVQDGIELAIGPDLPWVITADGHQYRMSGEVRARVRRDSPDAAESVGRHVLEARMRTGEQVTATADVRCTQTFLWAQGEVRIDGQTVFTRTWDRSLQERHDRTDHD